MLMSMDGIVGFSLAMRLLLVVVLICRKMK